jgi:hypothetical protein
MKSSQGPPTHVSCGMGFDLLPGGTRSARSHTAESHSSTGQEPRTESADRHGRRATPHRLSSGPCRTLSPSATTCARGCSARQRTPARRRHTKVALATPLRESLCSSPSMSASWSGDDVDVVIVGSGVSGIAAAHYLRKQCPQVRDRVMPAAVTTSAGISRAGGMRRLTRRRACRGVRARCFAAAIRHAGAKHRSRR